MLLPVLLFLDITIMALLAGAFIYSRNRTKYGDQIGLYWSSSTSEKAADVFLYLAVPVIDLFHILAQLVAYLSTPRRRGPSNKQLGTTTTTTTNTSLLHPAATLYGALVAFGLWVYQVTIAGIVVYVGWENYRDGMWDVLAAARAVFGTLIALLWAVYAGWSAAAVHGWRRERVRVVKERAREEGRRQGWEEGRMEAEAEGFELRGLERGGKISGETMVDVDSEDGGRKD